MKIRIGVDPDSVKNGVAIFRNGKLTDLKSLDVFSIFDEFKELKAISSDIQLHIENVEGNKSAFTAKNKRVSENSRLAIAQRVGKCKKAQLDVELAAEKLCIKTIRHRISKKWKSQAEKKEFELVTGWTGRSNEDTRSAAYFGFLGCK